MITRIFEMTVFIPFFDLSRNVTHTYSVVLNAAYEGEYFLPAVECSAMYDKEVQAVNTGMKVAVIRPLTLASN